TPSWASCAPCGTARPTWRPERSRPPRSVRLMGGPEPAHVLVVLGADHVGDRVDQGQVGEGLREVTQMPSIARIDLLGVELEWAREAEQTFAQPRGAGQFSDLHQRRHQPERADGEGT